MVYFQRDEFSTKAKRSATPRRKITWNAPQSAVPDEPRSASVDPKTDGEDTPCRPFESEGSRRSSISRQDGSPSMNSSATDRPLRQCSEPCTSGSVTESSHRISEDRRQRAQSDVAPESVSDARRSRRRVHTDPSESLPKRVRSSSRESSQEDEDIRGRLEAIKLRKAEIQGDDFLSCASTEITSSASRVSVFSRSSDGSISLPSKESRTRSRRSVLSPSLDGSASLPSREKEKTQSDVPSKADRQPQWRRFVPSSFRDTYFWKVIRGTSTVFG